MVRGYLTIVGLLYGGLAAWCALDPATTSQSVGFELQGGSGLSEFVTVYGGLELGLAGVFCLPWLMRGSDRFALASCLIIHANLVAFRSWSFLRFNDFAPMTYQLAVGEWVIFGSALCLLIWAGKRDPNSGSPG